MTSKDLNLELKQLKKKEKNIKLLSNMLVILQKMNKNDNCLVMEFILQGKNDFSDSLYDNISSKIEDLKKDIENFKL
jgi:hypothetical protein